MSTDNGRTSPEKSTTVYIKGSDRTRIGEIKSHGAHVAAHVEDSRDTDIGTVVHMTSETSGIPAEVLDPFVRALKKLGPQVEAKQIREAGSRSGLAEYLIKTGMDIADLADKVLEVANKARQLLGWPLVLAAVL